MYRFVAACCAYNNEFHLQPFQILSVVCAASVVIPLASTFMELEVDVWIVVVLAMGGSTLCITGLVLRNIVKSDSYMSKGVPKMLRHQIRLNRRARADLVERERNMLNSGSGHSDGLDSSLCSMEAADERLGLLAESIEEMHVHPKMFGLDLEREKMVRVGVGLGTGLVTTIFRLAVRFEET
jgi:hypothetical protein